MSDGQSYHESRRNAIKSCLDKIYATKWKKIEGDYEITTTVDYKGNHTITKRRVSDAK